MTDNKKIETVFFAKSCCRYNEVAFQQLAAIEKIIGACNGRYIVNPTF